jgi:hypothetical protein
MSYITKEAYDDDIVVRLRNWRGRPRCSAGGGELFEQAADEIERLYAEVARLRETTTLTDEEREAVKISVYALRDRGDRINSGRLCNMLARIK